MSSRAVSAWFDDPARQPIARLATVRAPILAIHGEDDRTVPVAQAELLARAAAACGVTLSLEKVAGMGHDIQFERDDLWPAIWQRIVAFLERASA
jgi:pimeloyl-ACP methyl ester carboxylesterase